jgi:hypothetical protein
MTLISTCPYCHAVDAVTKLVEFAMPARTSYTNRNAELLQCADCQQVFMSIYEEEPNDGGVSEAWNSYYYYLPQPLQHDLLIHATLCTTPHDASCQCAMHQVMSELDISQLQRLP